MLFKYQVVLLWIAVACYGLNFLYSLAEIIFQAHKGIRIIRVLSYLGFGVHSAALALRWLEVGHGPYYNFYEVLVSDAWMAVLFYLFLQWRWRPLPTLGTFLWPIALLMIGAAVLETPQIQPLPETYATYWLLIHVLFAKFAYGACLLSFAFAGLYLLKEKAEERGWRAAYWRKLPGLEELDKLNYRFAGFGFMVLGIMIASGSIWAYKAWGRYWGWDPIETWAAISWLSYGAHLHLRRTFGWKGHASAWLAVLNFVLVLFSYFSLTYLYSSVHENLQP